MKNTFKLLDAMRSVVIIALVLIVGFAMTACKDDDNDDPPPQSVLYGTWKSETEITWRQLTIAENKIVYIDKENYGYTIENLTWTAVTNDGTLTNSGDKTTYPSGFSFTGTIIQNNGYTLGANINESLTRTFFLKENDKTEFWYQGPSTFNVFAKQ
jgi:hypothetical protein